MPTFLVLDQSKNGPAVIQRQGVRQMLSLIAVNSFGRFARGSVKGFDELYHGNLDEHCKDLYKNTVDAGQHCFWKGQLRVGIVYRPTEEEKKWQDLQVEVCGSWNNWQKQTMMKLPYGELAYLIYLDFEYLCTYEYKFCVSGFWKTQPNKKTNEHFNHFFELNDSHKPKYLYLNYGISNNYF